MSYTRQEFVSKFTPFVNKVTKGTGILPGTLFTQAILESQGKASDGKYYVGQSKLSREANNYFGIKSSPAWKGKTYNIETGEQKPSGEKYVVKADFRKYDTVQDSIKDYVKFLQDNPRYKKAGVFDAKTVQEQAEALRRAGYATALDYADVITKMYDGIKDFIKDAEKNSKKKAVLMISAGVALASVLGLIWYAVATSKKK